MFNFGGMPGGMGGMGGMGRSADVDTTGLYTTLGVAKDANDRDIKKAYRKMAMKHHPDKGGDPEKFKEISKAYEILSDGDKRAVYDQHGEEGLERGGGGGGMDPSDIFSQMFGGGGGRRGQQRQRKGKDVLFRLKVTLEDMYTGATKKLRLSKSVVCKDCNGKGGKNVVTCSECRGQGVKMVVRQIGPGMLQQMQVECPRCDGQGEQINPADRCKPCKGQKVLKEKKVLDVHIEKGMKQGSRIVFRAESDQAPGILPGDVIVELIAEEHPLFKREGSQLFLKKKISLSQALTGLEFKLEHLDGRILLVKADDMVISPGSFKCVRDEGMPRRENPTLTGDLFVNFEIDFPTGLSDEAQATLKKVLKNPLCSVEGDQSEMEDVMVEDVNLKVEERMWADEKRRARGGGEHYDEDEDDHHGHGGGGQQCHAQ